MRCALISKHKTPERYKAISNRRLLISHYQFFCHWLLVSWIYILEESLKEITTVHVCSLVVIWKPVNNKTKKMQASRISHVKWRATSRTTKISIIKEIALRIICWGLSLPKYLKKKIIMKNKRNNITADINQN